jgi:hypothetical protein
MDLGSREVVDFYLHLDREGPGTSLSNFHAAIPATAP